MTSPILEKLSKPDLEYLKRYYPEEVKNLENSKIADINLKNLPSEVSTIVKKTNETNDLTKSPQLQQQKILEQEAAADPSNLRSPVEKLVERLQHDPKQLATELTKLSKNQDISEDLAKAMGDNPKLAAQIQPHLPSQLQPQPPHDWISKSLKTQQAEQQPAENQEKAPAQTRS